MVGDLHPGLQINLSVVLQTMSIPMLLSKPLIAVDIGSSAVKMALLSGLFKSKKLESIGVELIGGGAVSEGIIHDEDEVLRAIKKIIKDQDIDTKHRRVALSLSDEVAQIRRLTVNLEGRNKKEFVDILQAEVSTQFELDLNQMYLRYSIVKSKFSMPGEEHVIVSVAKIDLIEQFVNIAHSLGLRVGVMDSEITAAINAIDNAYILPKNLLMIVNVGASTTSIVFTFGSEFLFSRSIQVGGHHVTQRIAESAGVDFENAEGLKIAASLGDSGIAERISPAIQEVCDVISTEIRQILEFFLSSGEFNEVGKLRACFLLGGGAMTLGLKSNLAAQIHAPVSIANPFKSMSVSTMNVDNDYHLTHGSLFGVAAGLALRRIND